MRQQLVLPCRYVRGEVLVGDGAIQPAGEITPFEVVAKRFWVQMLYRATEVVHRRGWSDVLAVYRVKVELPLTGQRHFGVFVPVTYVCGPAVCESERTSRPGTKT
jgi:hypothetical protein